MDSTLASEPGGSDDAPSQPQRERPTSSVLDMDKIDKIDRASSVATSMDVPAGGPNAPHLSLGVGNHLSLDDVAPVDVQIRNLDVTVDTSPSALEPATYPALLKDRFGGSKARPDPAAYTKDLLSCVSASLAPGTLTAILGGSGSGKTTLLNTVSSRIASSRLSQSGSILFNSQPSIDSVRSAYVTQTDILLPTLTARETLQYSADLRLPPPSTSAERRRVVEEVIMELGLKEAADTRVGSTTHRGLSGGEKRRVSIGVQMLANPSVLFLDEPTTGLDASSAFQLVRTLKNLAAKGRTVIVTIHQPRSEIWGLFDNLVLLSRGSPVYSGPVSECLPWFEELGFRTPPFVNPAEHLVDLAAVDNRTPELEAESLARVEQLKGAWREENERRFTPTEKGPDAPAERGMMLRRHTNATAFARQMRVMTSRTFKTTYRDPMGMMAAIMQAVIMGLCTGYIFYQLGRDQAGIRSRQGFLYTTSALEGYLFLVFEVYRLTQEIGVFDREHSEGCATALPFLASRRLARLITEDFPVPLIFAVICYWMAGLDQEPSRFLTYFGIVLLNHYIAVTCAMCCVTASRNFPGASLIANLAYTLQSMACGYFIQSNSIAVWLRWLKYLTYTYYVFSALCGNEFHDSFYDCPYPGGESDPSCAPYTGTYILKSLGFPKGWLIAPIVVALAFVIFFYALSWIGLTFVRKEMTIARARVSEHDLSAGKEKLAARSIEEIRTIDVGLDKFALDLDKRSPWGRKLPRKTILHPVTSTFEAGKLNVIMGPSGSGKTSLLNAMALRLNSSLGTRYRPAGRLAFNGAEPSDSVIRSVCSYVCQDDDALLPSLTVRETLRFAAGLRLPSFMSKAEKNRRAEEVLLKMGLKDCADNLIGNELVKGISGGEKRRVTIAVQVLTDPRILLLDEPTSGLDAFTANSIMEVLRGLAAEGRTLILSIHQARSDLFGHFGNVLLLARGGKSVYSGAAGEMLGYFARVGKECPRNVNPADFVMDLITVDLQQQSREDETRKSVNGLIEAWDKNLNNPQASDAHPAAAQERLEPITEEKTSGSPRPSRDNDNNNTTPTTTKQGQPRRSNGKSHLATPAELGALVRKRTSFVTSFPLLLHRATINFRRQPPLILARLMQVVGLAVVLTAFFAPLKSDYTSVQNRVGFVQQVGSFYFVGMLQNVAVYPAERDVFYREHDDGAYGVEAFLLTYTALELPFEVVSTLVYGVLADLAVGFPRTAEMYFVCVFVCFGIVSCGESLGIMFNTLFSDHTGFAVTLTSILLSVANIMAGIMSIDMPPLFDAFNYISPCRYAVRALAPVSLRGQRFSCEADQTLPDGSCVLGTGERVLDLYGLNVDVVVNIAALAGMIVAYRLVAYLLLRLVRTKWERRGKVVK
ncbi:putative pleiotropic drug resistance protein 1 [Diaporthe ampelina]|uniref:Putative pleiotropic drug resistance protein 1 n=1 Tax=Diaporthe ampelina TaxID=1214573 RepID=A0A0G2FAC9_9PEZI|nr:putative pleiotropic drug resistance protein 1 [Diaporthe ampelina]